MNKIINELTKSIDNIKQSINNKYTSQNEDAPIGDDTLLKDYASAIDNILTETVDISQQIFVFYCWATNETDARSKTKPTITWNNSTNKWSIECTLGGWGTSADEEELDPNQPNAEKYLYAMFVSVNTDTNSSNITWPDPIRLTGKTGAKGEDGSDGRDGVIAGMVQYLAAHLFKIVRREDVTTELTNKPELIYDYTQILSEANRHPKSDFLQIKNSLDQYVNISSTVNTPGTWGLSYELPSDNPENYAVLKCIANYNSLSRDVVVTDPIMLSGEGVVGWIEHYCITNNNTLPGDDATWTNNEIPNEFYDLGKHYLWNKTEIKYDSGRTVTTSPVMIMSSPNAIGTIECLYGQSSNISTEPDEWNENIPNDFIVLWKKETTNFTIGNSKVTITPIAVKGNPGVDILAQVEEEHVDRWTHDYMVNFDSAEYYLKKGIIVGKDLYIWNGPVRPDWTNKIFNTTDYYWIIIEDAFATKVQADWNEDDDTMPGYIKNRPITSNDWEVEVCTNNLYFTNSKIYLPVFPHVKVNTITLSLPNGLSGQNEYILTKDNNTCTIDGTTFTWEDSIITASSNVFVDGPVPMCVTMSGTQIRLSQKYVDNIIDLGDKALLKISLLRNSSKLIPGSTYKFTYKNVEYLVDAIDSETLADTCTSKSHTIVVNWDFVEYHTLKGYPPDDMNISVCGRWIKSSWQDGNVFKTVYYEIETNCFCYYPGDNNSDFIELDVNRLDVRGYKDRRGNEWNALYSAEAEMLQEFNILFDGSCFGNKVNVYVTNPNTFHNIYMDFSENSNNNVISCYDVANVKCRSSSNNTVSTFNNHQSISLSTSHLNNVALYNEVPLVLLRARCNSVNICGGSVAYTMKLSDTECNLVMLSNPNSADIIDDDYHSCVILNQLAFDSSDSGVGKVFASKVVTLS